MLEFSLKIFYGGLCHLWLHIFNKIKVYWNVWVFDYFHSSFYIETRDVINFLSCRRKNKSYRRMNRLAKPVSHLAQLGGIYGRGSGVPRGSGINGAKSCILAISWHQICFLKYLIFLWTFLTNTIFKTWRRYFLWEPFRHSLNSNPDTHIIKNNWIF